MLLGSSIASGYAKTLSGTMQPGGPEHFALIAATDGMRIGPIATTAAREGRKGKKPYGLWSKRSRRSLHVYCNDTAC